MIIRELFEEDAPLLLAFFLGLRAPDRSRRFGRPMADESINAYVEKLVGPNRCSLALSIPMPGAT
jgi:hypothetical protein